MRAYGLPAALAGDATPAPAWRKDAASAIAIPGKDDNYFLFKGMSLKTVASLSHGQISTDALQTIAGQLKFVPISVASANAQARDLTGSFCTKRFDRN